MFPGRYMSLRPGPLWVEADCLVAFPAPAGSGIRLRQSQKESRDYPAGPTSHERRNRDKLQFGRSWEGRRRVCLRLLRERCPPVSFERSGASPEY